MISSVSDRSDIAHIDTDVPEKLNLGSGTCMDLNAEPSWKDVTYVVDFLVRNPDKIARVHIDIDTDVISDDHCLFIQVDPKGKLIVLFDCDETRWNSACRIEEHDDPVSFASGLQNALVRNNAALLSNILLLPPIVHDYYQAPASKYDNLYVSAVTIY